MHLIKQNWHETSQKCLVLLLFPFFKNDTVFKNKSPEEDVVPLFDPKVHLFENSLLKTLAQLLCNRFELSRSDDPRSIFMNATVCL